MQSLFSKTNPNYMYEIDTEKFKTQEVHDDECLTLKKKQTSYWYSW